MQLTQTLGVGGGKCRRAEVTGPEPAAWLGKRAQADTGLTQLNVNAGPWAGRVPAALTGWGALFWGDRGEAGVNQQKKSAQCNAGAEGPMPSWAVQTGIFPLDSVLGRPRLGSRGRLWCLQFQEDVDPLEGSEKSPGKDERIRNLPSRERLQLFSLMQSWLQGDWSPAWQHLRGEQVVTSWLVSPAEKGLTRPSGRTIPAWKEAVNMAQAEPLPPGRQEFSSAGDGSAQPGVLGSAPAYTRAHTRRSTALESMKHKGPQGWTK